MDVDFVIDRDDSDISILARGGGRPRWRRRQVSCMPGKDFRAAPAWMGLDRCAGAVVFRTARVQLRSGAAIRRRPGWQRRQGSVFGVERAHAFAVVAVG